MIAALAWSACLEAQTVKGIVMENDSSSIPYATVSLLQAKDSAYIVGAMGREDGTFSFDAPPAGHLVRVSCVGYSTIIVPAGDNMVIRLQPTAQNLSEVTVSAVRPTFKMTQGVFVANIEGTVLSKLGKATDVLHQLPMMSTEGVSVLGKGTPLVYINNKQMRDMSELERITSDMIKEVKIDMNPGAKFGSDVRCVLYITTVKPVGEGLGGSITMNESVSSSWGTDGYLNLNYRRKQLDVFLSSSYSTVGRTHYKRQDVYDFRYKDRSINAEYDGDGYNSSKNGFVSLGINDQINNRQSVGAIYTFTRVFGSNADQNYRNRVTEGNRVTEFDTDARHFSQNSNHKLSLYYENKFSDELSLNIDGIYAHNEVYGKQTITDTQPQTSSTLVPVTRSKSDLGALKAVFASPVGGGKLEYGFETTYTRFLQKYNVENKDYQGVLNANDNESKQAAANVFADYSRSIGKLYTQIGLKYEYTDYNYYAAGKQLDGSSRTYNRVLPSVMLAYNLDRLALSLSYNIYTSSPTYSQLDDGLQFISDFSYSKGNSQLRPTYEHTVALDASYGNFQAMCNYTYSDHSIITWFDVMDEIPAVVSGYANHSYSTMYASLSYSPTLFKIWRPSWNVWIFKQWLTYKGISYNRPQCGLQWQNLIVLPQNWYIMVNANGNLKGNADTYTSRPKLNVNLTVQKNMNNWWFRLMASNIFNAKEKGYSHYVDIYNSHYVDFRQPTISLTISYSFNTARSKYKGKTAGESELKRL